MTTNLLSKLKRFSLRSLFVLMTACCVFFGVWSVYINPYRMQDRALAEVNRLQGRATVQSADGPRWHRWLVTALLGDDTFVHVTDVELHGFHIQDAQIQSLAGLAHLKSLTITCTHISDEGIASLRSMKELKSLSLRHANITDRSANVLSTLVTLNTLHLTGTKISDAAIADLVKLRQLTELFIRWTKITDAGAEKIAAALPNCAVYHHALAD